MKNFIIKAIDRYQERGGGKAIFGIDCCFSPTCSEHTKRAVIEYGVLKGLALGLKQILKCR